MIKPYWHEALKDIPESYLNGEYVPEEEMKSEIAKSIQNRITGSTKFRRLASDTITDWAVKRELRIDLLDELIDAREEWHRKRLAKYGELINRGRQRMVIEQLNGQRTESMRYATILTYLIERMTR